MSSILVIKIENKTAGSYCSILFIESIMSELLNFKDLIHPDVFESQTPQRDTEIHDLKEKISKQESLIDDQSKNLKAATELIKRLKSQLDAKDKKFNKFVGENDILIEQLDTKLFSVREENRILKQEKADRES